MNYIVTKSQNKLRIVVAAASERRLCTKQPFRWSVCVFMLYSYSECVSPTVHLLEHQETWWVFIVTQPPSSSSCCRLLTSFLDPSLSSSERDEQITWITRKSASIDQIWMIPAHPKPRTSHQRLEHKANNKLIKHESAKMPVDKLQLPGCISTNIQRRLQQIRVLTWKSNREQVMMSYCRIDHGEAAVIQADDHQLL